MELGMAVPLIVAWVVFFLWDFALLVLGQGPWGYQFAVSLTALYLPVMLLLAANPQCKAARWVVLVALLVAFLPRLQTVSENVWHKIAHGARKPSFGITEANYGKIVAKIAALPEGGLFVWAELPPELDAMQVFEAAVENNVAFVPGTHFYPDGGHLNTLRLNFSMCEIPTINEGMERLGSVICKMRN